MATIATNTQIPNLDSLSDVNGFSSVVNNEVVNLKKVNGVFIPTIAADSVALTPGGGLIYDGLERLGIEQSGTEPSITLNPIKFTGDLNDTKIINLADPNDLFDAANKHYVDDLTVYNVFFKTESKLLSATNGAFSKNAPEWTSNQTINHFTYIDVLGENRKVYLINDDDESIWDIESTITLAQLDNLQLYGGKYTGIAALGLLNGSLGFFVSLETQSATSIVGNPFPTGDDRRLNIKLSHNGSYCSLTAIEGTPARDLDGVTEYTSIAPNGEMETITSPLVLPGQYLKFEIHVRDGLQNTMFLYINDVLVANPTFAINTGGLGGTRLLYTSGASGGVDRVSYLNKYGVIIGTEPNEKTLDVERLTHSFKIQFFADTLVQDYTLNFPSGINYRKGYEIDIQSNNLGMLMLVGEQDPVDKSSSFNGYQSISSISPVRGVFINNFEGSGSFDRNFSSVEIDVHISADADLISKIFPPTISSLSIAKPATGVYNITLNPSYNTVKFPNESIQVTPGFTSNGTASYAQRNGNIITIYIRNVLGGLAIDSSFYAKIKLY